MYEVIFVWVCVLLEDSFGSINDAVENKRFQRERKKESTLKEREIIFVSFKVKDGQIKDSSRFGPPAIPNFISWSLLMIQPPRICFFLDFFLFLRFILFEL